MAPPPPEDVRYEDMFGHRARHMTPTSVTRRPKNRRSFHNEEGGLRDHGGGGFSQRGDPFGGDVYSPTSGGSIINVEGLRAQLRECQVRAFLFHLFLSG